MNVLQVLHNRGVRSVAGLQGNTVATVYDGEYTVYCVRWIVYGVLCTMESVRWMVYDIHLTMGSVRRTVDGMGDRVFT